MPRMTSVIGHQSLSDRDDWPKKAQALAGGAWCLAPSSSSHPILILPGPWHLVARHTEEGPRKFSKLSSWIRSSYQVWPFKGLRSTRISVAFRHIYHASEDLVIHYLLQVRHLYKDLSVSNPEYNNCFRCLFTVLEIPRELHLHR